MKFIDTHTHLYDEAFYENISQFVAEAQAAGVQEMYLPNCDSTTIPAMMDIVALHPEALKPMMGIHPCYIKENYKEELAIAEAWLNRYDFAAVGEIGLDYYWDKTFVAEQKEAFNIQMQWAKEKELPIIIHTRDSIDDGIAMVKAQQNGNLKGIFHCFGGTIEQAKAIIDLGFHLGIGGVVTFKNSQLDQVLAAIPLEHIVLETDAPYLAPVPYRGKRNESKYIPYIAEKLVTIYQSTLEEVAQITTANAKNVYKY